MYTVHRDLDPENVFVTLIIRYKAHLRPPFCTNNYTGGHMVMGTTGIMYEHDKLLEALRSELTGVTVPKL